MKTPVRIVTKRCTSSTANFGQRKELRRDMSSPSTAAAESSTYESRPAARAAYQTALIGHPLMAYERVEGVWGNREVPPHRREEGSRERAGGERRSGGEPLDAGGPGLVQRHAPTGVDEAAREAAPVEPGWPRSAEKERRLRRDAG